MRRAFGNRGSGPALGFIADAEGLRVKARFADAAVEYHAPGEHPTETLWLPFQFLADCEGKKDEPVELAAADKGRVTAQWRNGSVPQIVSYDCEPPADADKFPGVPETFAENPPRLLQSLADAGESCDPDSVRFALACLQLRGQQGSIGATDGRQLLVQSGYTFPWEGDILIPRSKVFSSPELAGDHPVLVGKAGDYVAFRTGPWTIWIAVNKDGRFPDLSRHIPQPADATARCTLSATDAAFLAQSLPSLPSDDAYNFPVTLDLNGYVAIRAKAVDQAKPTEIVLSGSSWSGEPVRLNMNRKFLARALKLGFHDLLVYGDKVPVVCHDEHRHFVWATLEPESAIPPAEDAIRIESPQAATDNSIPQPKRRTPTVNESSTNSNSNGSAASNGNGQANGHAKTNGQARKATGRKAELQDSAALIAQAEKFRTALHDLMHQANGLVKSLKQHRRQSRAIQSTLDSIRQLKGLGV
jgi:hypothetical protein